MIDEQITLQKSGDGWVYTVPTSLGEMLSSTISYPFYHAVTLEYTDASHIQHKATAVYTSGSDSADENEDSNITSTDYYNDSLNYSLKLPQSFVDNGYAKRNPGGRQYPVRHEERHGRCQPRPDRGRRNYDSMRGCNRRFAQRIRRKLDEKLSVSGQAACREGRFDLLSGVCIRCAV